MSRKTKKSYVDEFKERDAIDSLATYSDIDKRFVKPYKDDPTIDNMYARKKKTKKSKTKRAKKNCGCK
jgi:hypothetical protein